MAEKKHRISGIFSKRDKSVIGFGSTKQKVESQTLWYARETEDGKIVLQPLSERQAADGPKSVLSREELFRNYVLEPELSYSMLTKRLLQGEAYLRQKQYSKAEDEYQKVLAIDVENIQANFGIGLAYLSLGETEKCEYVLERLVALDETFQPEHKHLFNEFGISLRKSGLHDQALRYYSRALDLSRDDENLYLNMARAAFEKGDAEDAFDCLQKALTVCPDFKTAESFASYLLRQGHRPRKEQYDFFRSYFPQGGRIYLAPKEPE